MRSRTCMICALLQSVLSASPCDSGIKQPVPWEHLGPAGYVGPDGGIASAGAAQAAVHLNGTEWLLATANGGIWRTSDVTARPEPLWAQVLDSAPVACTSISAMSEAVHGTVLAGCGAATSSEMGDRWDVANSGDWGGVMVSRDGGRQWAMTSFPANSYVSSVVVLSPSSFLVGVRSHLFDTNGSSGGIFKSVDGGTTWAQIFDRPVFELRYRPPHLLATLPWSGAATAVVVSSDGGRSFVPWASGVDWSGRTPFYPTLALGQGVVFLGALTVNQSNLSDTASALFVRSLSELPDGRQTRPAAAGPPAGWRPVAGAPRLDRDGMPKDRMALLAHPADEAMLFVAGNADALVWRVAWREGVWTEAAGRDTSDGSAPHGDCRNYYWEPMGGSLILLNDGGAHMRSQPDARGGTWHSLAGNTGAMEFISAHYEPATNSWVGGAQDNCVQFAFNAKGTTRAIGFIEGDGTVTAVDNTVTPVRYYGATQFLGNFEDDDAPSGAPSRAGRRSARRLRPRSHEDERVGFGYATYEASAARLHLTAVPLLPWFDIDQFPFFAHPVRFACRVVRVCLTVARMHPSDSLPPTVCTVLGVASSECVCASPVPRTVCPQYRCQGGECPDGRQHHRERWPPCTSVGACRSRPARRLL